MKRRIESLQAEIEAIKRRIVKLGDLRVGHLSQQYNTCGNPKCRCKDMPPRKHGPYYQLSFTRKGKSRTQFVQRQHLSIVKRQVRNYARLRALVDRWVDLATELSAIQIKDNTRRKSRRHQS